MLVRLCDEAGHVGYGEAAPVRGFGTETVADVQERLAALGARCSAAQLADVAAGGGCLAFAMAGALAEWRERAQGHDQDPPAADGAGSPAARSPLEYLPVAALLPAGRAGIAAAVERAELGFRTFKWKVGVGDPRDERGLCDDLMAELPPESRLRLDANGAWDRRQAEAWLTLCAERPMVDYVEQPIAATARGAEDLLRGLAEDYPTTLALDESLVGAADLRRWIDGGWRGVWVLKPALWGDPTELLDWVRRHRLDVVWSSALETAVGAKAILRTAFADGGTEGRRPRALGAGVWPLFDSRWANGPTALPFWRRSDLEKLDPAAVWEGLAQ